jgi:uncharacterized protein YndB with AHSA1/START domain
MTTETTNARTIEREMIFPVTTEHAYETVATPEGWRRWLIEDGEIEPLDDGWLHLKWDIGAKVQVKILNTTPNESIQMEWYAPSEPGRTMVTFRVASTSGAARFRLTETGFGEGDDWDRCYNATNEVWDFALERLKAALDGS